MEEVFVGKENVAKVIGKRGNVKKLLEKRLGVKVLCSKGGDVSIEGKGKDAALREFLGLRVLQAIVYGFAIDDALQLADEDFDIKVVGLKEYGKSAARLKQVKGRLIGKEGKVKRTLENLSGCKLCVSGNEVVIVGNVIDIDAAVNAVCMLLGGAPHSRVFSVLEGKEGK